VASQEQLEDAGNTGYRDHHLAKMLKEGFSFSGFERDPVYLNLGDRTYLDIAGVSGIDSESDGRAGVFADFDNDGDLDVFVTTIQGQAQLLFRNNVGQQNRWLRITLEGTDSGRDAFGAVVRLETGLGTQTKLKPGGSGYLSQHDDRLLFGLGASGQASKIEVRWPSGTVDRITGSFSSGSLRIVEGSGQALERSEQVARLPDPWSSAEELASKLKVRMGQTLPDIAVVSRAGEPGSLGGLTRSGRRTLLNLWATWCGPCRKELPGLERLKDELAGSGLDVIGLSIDRRDASKADAFLTGLGVTYPNYVVTGEGASEIYAGEDFFVPLSFVLDEEGQVLGMFKGWSADTLQRVKELLSK